MPTTHRWENERSACMCMRTHECVCVRCSIELVPCGFIVCETINMLCSMNRQKEAKVAYAPEQVCMHIHAHSFALNAAQHRRCLFGIQTIHFCPFIYFRRLNALLLHPPLILLFHVLNVTLFPTILFPCTLASMDSVFVSVLFIFFSLLFLISHMILIILIHGREYDQV